MELFNYDVFIRSKIILIKHHNFARILNRKYVNKCYMVKVILIKIFLSGNFQKE